MQRTALLRTGVVCLAIALASACGVGGEGTPDGGLSVDAQVVQSQRVVQVWNDDGVRRPELLKPPNQSGIDGAVIGEQDVSCQVVRELPGCARRVSGLQPRCIEELDEREGQQDQHEHGARQHHHDRERPQAWDWSLKDIIG